MDKLLKMLRGWRFGARMSDHGKVPTLVLLAQQLPLELNKEVGNEALTQILAASF
jgi:hypothetical protein